MITTEYKTCLRYIHLNTIIQTFKLNFYNTWHEIQNTTVLQIQVQYTAQAGHNRTKHHIMPTLQALLHQILAESSKASSPAQTYSSTAKGVQTYTVSHMTQ